MKRILCVISTLALLLGLCACGQAAWKEQYELGLRYLSEGGYEEAIVAFTAAIEIDPKRAEAYVSLAKVYIATKDYEKAEDTITNGQTVCGEQDIFDDILRELAKKHKINNETSERLDLREMLQLDNVVNYHALPALFSAPFNELENYLPIANISKAANHYYEDKETGSYSNMDNTWDYSIDIRRCDYDFYDPSDPARPNISSGNRIMAVAPAEGTSILSIDIQLVRETIDEVGYYGSIGLLDIRFGDSYSEALAKLGLSDLQEEDWKSVSVTLFEDGSAFGWGAQRPSIYYDDPNTPIIDLKFYSSGQVQDGKYVELVFGEDSRLNFVRYYNYDLLISLAEKQ